MLYLNFLNHFPYCMQHTVSSFNREITTNILLILSWQRSLFGLCLKRHRLHYMYVNAKSRPRWLSWMRRPTGDQEVAGSTPAEVGNTLLWRLIMKYFLHSVPSDDSRRAVVSFWWKNEFFLVAKNDISKNLRSFQLKRVITILNFYLGIWHSPILSKTQNK